MGIVTITICKQATKEEAQALFDSLKSIDETANSYCSFQETLE